MFIKKKKKSLTSKGVFFHQDSAKPLIAKKTLELIENLGWAVVSHPPYSPDLVPSDYHLFGLQKNYLCGTKFSDDERVNEICREWLKCQPRDFCAKGILKLVHRWEK